MEKSPKKILVIEAERPLARAFELKLEHNGYEVTMVNTGKEGIRKLGSENYQIVITDLAMPEMNGFEIIEHIRKHNQDLPIIVLANSNQKIEIQKIHNLGIEDCFIKSSAPIANIIKHIDNQLKK